jgi:pyruvate-formate lyase-activating enzyme
VLRVLYDDAAPAPPDGAPRFPEAPATFAAGFHGEEREDSEAFRWMGREGRLAFPAAPLDAALEAGVFSPYHDLSQTLTVEVGGERRELELAHGWGLITVPVPAGATEARLRASKPLPPAHHPGDPRELAVRLRAPRLHADPARRESVERQHANAVLNLREMLEGRGELASTPTSLGIDLHGVCNVKPPCVYCDWDVSKGLEGDAVDVPFTRETLDEWGEFFENAGGLVNCSIGEPFMMKDLDRVLDAFGERGKSLEMATNGQILTDRNIQKLLGRRIHLYVSLDAATAETYARLRNEKFERILGNLRRLIAAKGGRAGLPKVHLVFMPMRANLHELEAFVHLAAELGVDRMVLRPLNYDEGTSLDWVRGGYHFRYTAELLPWDELVRASGRAAELARRLGVELSDQMDFGGQGLEAGFAAEYERGRREAAGGAAEPSPEPGAEGASEAAEAPVTASAPSPAEPPPSLGEERLPVCLEPWKSLYILRRGVLPCCHGSAPLAAMDEYRETWNSPTLRAIRTELAAGRFHEYCLSSEACPIVRKWRHAAPQSRSDRAFLALKRLWHRVDRLGLGVPKRLARPLRGRLLALARRASDLIGD